MTTITKPFGWATMLGLCAFIAVAAQAEEGMPKAPVYKPPTREGPKVRVDGHVRGTEDATLTLTVLAPESVGLTAKEQPSLYWFQSKSVSSRFELAIVETNKPKPVLEAKFETMTPGILQLRLADYNLSLVEGTEYRWSVAMVVDPANRSKDVVASGMIKRIKPTDKLVQRLKNAPASELPYIYADEGLWYDSLETLSELVDAKPQEARLHEIRAVYFMQVGLHDAAMYEMQLAGRTVSSSSLQTVPGH